MRVIQGDWNMGRILTLVLEIIDVKESEWMWSNHMGKKCYGVDIFCIAEGNLMCAEEHEEEHKEDYDC